MTKASRKRPRVIEMEGESVVVTVRAPGRRPEMKADAAMEAMSCEKMVWTARCQWILRVRRRAVVTFVELDRSSSGVSKRVISCCCEVLQGCSKVDLGWCDTIVRC